ncbi:hypothetical protein [Enhygromyxa salina]|uniref:Lipoprotein n=1 Tax=Enhygromyxa salina TaxID=215803 RepID=A0A2S9YPN7_9BACT|nr:hypothetical protein [Enhygromyxa salina]PRQ07019.1 hypothetical protein ENSA7_32430 [Enhygromyxa salina]
MSKPNHLVPSTLVMALSLALAACEFDPPPTPAVFLDLARAGDAAQPSSAEFGVHLVVQTWGGQSVWLEVDGGTLRRAGQDLAAGCVSAPGDGELVDVFVSPEQVEALVSASLYETGCPTGGTTRPSGEVLASDATLVTREVSSANDSEGGESSTDTSDESTT